MMKKKMFLPLLLCDHNEQESKNHKILSEEVPPIINLLPYWYQNLYFEL